MSTTVLGLHGYTMNGAAFAAHVAELGAAFGPAVQLVCPDAPHACSEQGVESVYGRWRGPRPPGPYRSWWDATDDGSAYRGWEQAFDSVVEIARAEAPIGIIGFSQGAIFGALLAASAQRGEFPALRFVVLVAGRKPRATTFEPWFAQRLRCPSLHVWGSRDAPATELAPRLADCFDPAQRELALWGGPHVVPTRGPAADAITAFVCRHS